MHLDPARGYDLIGDIHGCAKTLERLLSTLGYRQQAGVWQHPKRMAIFLGDLVDRGPDSPGVIEYLMRGHARGENWITLLGNHDRMFAGYLRDLTWHDPRLRADDHRLALGKAHNAAFLGRHRRLKPASEQPRDVEEIILAQQIGLRPVHDESFDGLRQRAGLLVGAHAGDIQRRKHRGLRFERR